MSRSGRAIGSRRIGLRGIGLRGIGLRGIGLRGYRPHGWVGICAALCVVAGASCSLLPVAGGMGDCSGALLATSDEPGDECIERMIQEGGGVASWLEREGKPDYFELSAKRIRLLFIERDQVIELSRSSSGALEARTTTPIRASDHMRFRNVDRVRLGQARVSRVPRALADVEERPNDVRRARVGERSGDAEREPPESDEPATKVEAP